jgi:hypothetical protein
VRYYSFSLVPETSQLVEKVGVLGRSWSQNSTEIPSKRYKTGLLRLQSGGKKGLEGVFQQPGPFLRRLLAYAYANISKLI